METQSLPFLLRILMGLPVALVAFYISDYFRKPEDFPVKRLRPQKGAEYTNSQLAFRALMSALLPTPVLMLWLAMLTSDEAFLEWRISQVVTAVIVNLYLGISSYIYFRLWRYRELTPNQRGGSERVFVRREAPNESNCLKCQHPTTAEFHRSPVLIMLLSMISSLRIHAVRATFFGFPAFSRRW